MRQSQQMGAASPQIGGIYSSRGPLMVTNSAITGNSSSGANSLDGGGLYIYIASTATLTNTTVKGNTATSYGAAFSALTRH